MLEFIYYLLIYYKSKPDELVRIIWLPRQPLYPIPKFETLKINFRVTVVSIIKKSFVLFNIISIKMLSNIIQREFPKMMVLLWILAL